MTFAFLWHSSYSCKIKENNTLPSVLVKVLQRHRTNRIYISPIHLYRIYYKVLASCDYGGRESHNLLSANGDSGKPVM